MKIFISSDHHFFHEKLLEYVQTRPSDYMELIINNHNKTVSNNDIWICIGDVSAGLGRISNGKEKLKEVLLSLNGFQKILIRGNHDHFSDEFYLECGFNKVVKYLQKNDDIFCHYALENNEYTSEQEKLFISFFKEKSFKRLFHGHTHARSVSLNDGITRINTCLDANNYYPIEYK